MDNFTWHYRDPEISITSRCAYSQPHYKERCVTTRVNSLATLSSTKYSNCNSSIRNSCVFQSSSRAKLLYYCLFYQIRNVYKRQRETETDRDRQRQRQRERDRERQKTHLIPFLPTPLLNYPRLNA